MRASWPRTVRLLQGLKQHYSGGKTDVDQLEIFIGRGFRKTKNSSIVIVTESPQNKNGGAMYYADRVKKEYPEYDVRVSILGHLQRGGAPSANDRILQAD